MKRNTKITLAVLSAAVVLLSAAPRLVQAEDHQTIALDSAIATVILKGMAQRCGLPPMRGMPARRC
ncbi:hypothetical protein P5P81_06140 [Tritonibacter mobilis]|nr:hypothetical protein [Tritonibacter mobilis]